MRRFLLLITAFALVIAACSPGVSDATPTTEAPSPDTTGPPEPVTTTSSGGGDDGTTTVPDATATTSDRPLAPDFTLELGDGGSYTLSDGAKPVYLVFWAEW